MPYDEELAERVRQALAGEPGVSEKRMFGGLAFLVGGNLAAAASSQGDLMFRCEPADSASHASHPHVRRVVMRGREMEGWLRVEPAALATAEDLGRWVDVGVARARSLPAK